MKSKVRCRRRVRWKGLSMLLNFSEYKQRLTPVVKRVFLARATVPGAVITQVEGQMFAGELAEIVCMGDQIGDQR